MSSQAWPSSIPSGAGLPRRAGRGIPVRESWIDIAKGIGIALVVYGHSFDGLHTAGLLSTDSPFGTAFYAIYIFHMALFFMLSGLMVGRRVEQDRARFVRKLSVTIAWPYFLWSAIQVTAIALASAYVNTPPTHFGLRTYLLMLWNPPSQFWFLYVLFFLHLGAALLIRRQISIAIPISVAILLYVLPEITGYRGRLFEMFCHFTLFYVLGVVVGRHLSGLKQWLLIDPLAKGALATGIFLSGVAIGLANGAYFWATAHLPTALAGTALVLILANHTHGIAAAVLRYLGERAMAIYVLHVLFVAGSRIVITRLTGIDDGAILVALLTGIGLLAPLIVVALAERLRLSTWLGLGQVPPRATVAHA